MVGGAWVSILALPLTCCVSSRKFLTLSGSWGSNCNLKDLYGPFLALEF